MQVTETSSEGLKRELKIVVEAGELDERLSRKLEELKERVQLKGFRPGKVPVAYLRKVYGRSVMAEIIEKAVAESSQQALSDREERPAFQPDISFSENQEELEQVLAGKADLAYTMAFEVLPEFDMVDLKSIELERWVAEVGEEEIAKSLEDLVEGAITYEAEEGRAAQIGDRLTIDFEGTIDGEPFEGGKGEGAHVILGKGGFIPGFEEGLEGAKAGDTPTIEATFPEDYPVDSLKGRTASFAVTVKEVARPVRPEIDDAFAKNFGLENVEKLREAVKQRLEAEFEKASRERLKRALLDALDEAHDFALPPTLVENEFESIWKEVTAAREQAGLEVDEAQEEERKAELRKIAERRVRLGLVLSEIGERNDIRVTEEELRQAMFEEARRYPGQEQHVLQYFKENPNALASLRAPIFEDKVVDFVLELAKIKDKKVTAEALFAPEGDDDDAGDADGAPEKKAGAKKGGAKKGGAKKAGAGEGEGEAESAAAKAAKS